MATTEMTDAVVFTGIGEVTVEKAPLPRMGPGDVVVEIEYSSISTGTERWCLMAKHHETGEPPTSPFPFIPGYQGAGVVIAARAQSGRSLLRRSGLPSRRMKGKFSCGSTTLPNRSTCPTRS